MIFIDNSHWNPRVFVGDLMNPLLQPGGNKLTALTLALLEDSNFFYSVDYSYS